MNIFLLPSRNIAVTIPVVLVAGFIAGLLVDTSLLKNFVLPVAVLMIYPTMIGFKIREIVNLSHAKLLLTASAINFILVPALAYLLGSLFLAGDPELFTGLVIASLLPTSNMTIAFTLLAGGNVPAAIKLTALSLVLGSLLAPWYLLVMLGTKINVDVLLLLKTITVVVFVPLILGTATYSVILRKYGCEYFNLNIKHLLPAVTTWGMVYVIFTGISTNAHSIVSRPDILFKALMVWVFFYAANYFMALTGSYFFNQEDSLTLVFGTVLRNLAISIGLAASTFGVTSALMVSLAFLFQGQSAAWFIRLNEKYKIFAGRKPRLLNKR